MDSRSPLFPIVRVTLSCILSEWCERSRKRPRLQRHEQETPVAPAKSSSVSQLPNQLANHERRCWCKRVHVQMDARHLPPAQCAINKARDQQTHQQLLAHAHGDAVEAPLLHRQAAQPLLQVAGALAIVPGLYVVYLVVAVYALRRRDLYDELT